MQPKKNATGEKSSAPPAPDPTATGAADAITLKRVGRPTTSPLDRKSQVRENVRAHRANLKAAGLEKVETYLPKAWRQFLQNSGEPLQQLGLEAFALLLAARGASDLVQAAKPARAVNESAD